MRSLVRLTLTEFLLELREPFSAFFSLVFPPLLVVIFGSIYGNTPRPGSGGFGVIDLAVPGYVTMVIATVAIFNLPIALATYRERGVLRQLALAPVSPIALFASQLAARAILSALGISFLLLTAELGYGLRFAGSLPSALAAGILGFLAMMAFGFALAALVPSARTALVVAFVVFYPMLFFSGMALPPEILPARVRELAEFLPATPIVTLLHAAWVAEPWSDHWRALLLLATWTTGSLAIATRRFRWQ